MATATKLTRVFLMNTVRLPDPDPKMTADEVRQLYIPSYPHLAAATCTEGEVKGAELHVRFEQPAVKTKG